MHKEIESKNYRDKEKGGKKERKKDRQKDRQKEGR
jgi:hypothetical protein